MNAGKAFLNAVCGAILLCGLAIGSIAGASLIGLFDIGVPVRGNSGWHQSLTNAQLIVTVGMASAVAITATLILAKVNLRSAD